MEAALPHPAMNSPALKTSVIVSLLALTGAACNDEDRAPRRTPDIANPSQTRTEVEANRDARTDAVAFESDRKTVTTDIFIPQREGERATEQALRDEANKRCALWAGYLEDGQQAAQRRADGRRGVDQASVQCDIQPDQVEDTGAQNGEGEKITQLLTKIKMTVDVLVPRGRTLARRVVNTFKRASRYDAWLDCHKAAGRAPAVAPKAIAFFCVEGDGQDTSAAKDAEGQYQSSLVVFEFARSERASR